MFELRGRKCDVVTVDFETFFDKDYTLSSMPTSAYVRDKRFYAQILGIQVNDQEVQTFTTPKAIKNAVKDIDWKNSYLLAHNTAFDGFILTQRYGVKPAGYLDTLSMARAIFGHAVSHRLDNVGKLTGLGGKQGSENLAKAKGIRILPPDLEFGMATYCARDVSLCYKLFNWMYDHFPDDEFELVDLTLRMFCEPRFVVDKALVEEEYEAEIGSKMRHVLATGAQRPDLLSTAKFTELLTAAGAMVPMKTSPTGKRIPALAKTDSGMRLLLKHPIEAVRKLAEARLAIRSTIGETRAQRFLDTAAAGKMPVLLNYYGAHTGRWSGGDKMNLQNLPRPGFLPDGKTPDPATGRLRRALRAPAGRRIVVADSGQIEARVNAWLAGQADMLQIFRDYDAGRGPDAYRVMASKLFGVPIDLVTKDQRFVGKICVLALGYGMGPEKLVATMANYGVAVSLDDATDWVDMYRRVNHAIKYSWRKYMTLVPHMTRPGCDIPLGPVTLVHEAIRLPNGLFIRYPQLQLSSGDWARGVGEASFQGRNARTKLYGGLICENLVQALSRCIIAEQMLTLSREGHRILTTTHDEIVVEAPAGKAAKVYKRMVEVMSTPPAWAPDLPLAASGGYAENYSK